MERKKRLDTGNPIVKFSKKAKNMVQVPSFLTPMQFSRYPPDNSITFERWYLNQWGGLNDECERLYLPIQWTALYCNNGYGNSSILHQIQKFIDGLDRAKKYYTIVQYDDGILNNIEHLDIKVCAMAGPRIDFSLPLLCTPHKVVLQVAAKEANKKYIASFIGNYTHGIRATIVDQLKDKEGYYVTTRHHNLCDYCNILAQSKYVLCPRGYGASSFRIQEAIDFGAIPIYISDEFIFPYNMPTFPFGLIATPDDNIEVVIKHAEENNFDKVILEIINRNRQLFTYQGCKQEILQHLQNETINKSNSSSAEQQGGACI